MSIIQLQNGNFVIVDTLTFTPALKSKFDVLTANGTKIEAGTQNFIS